MFFNAHDIQTHRRKYVHYCKYIYSSRFSSSRPWYASIKLQGSSDSFGLPRVFYFPGTHHIWWAFPYPPQGEAPDRRLATPHGNSTEIDFWWRSARISRKDKIRNTIINLLDRLCDLVIRVSGYKYRGPGFDPRRYQIFWVAVGLERGPLSLVSLVRSIEELLEWKK